MREEIKDVHTEHCCIIHGCKYNDPNCTVITEKAPQTYPCEDCEYAPYVVCHDDEHALSQVNSVDAEIMRLLNHRARLIQFLMKEPDSAQQYRHKVAGVMGGLLDGQAFNKIYEVVISEIKDAI